MSRPRMCDWCQKSVGALGLEVHVETEQLGTLEDALDFCDYNCLAEWSNANRGGPPRSVKGDDANADY